MPACKTKRDGPRRPAENGHFAKARPQKAEAMALSSPKTTLCGKN